MLTVENLSLPKTNKQRSNIQQVYKQHKIIRARKVLETLKNHSKKNERTSQRTHVQNNAFANKSRCTYVHNVRKLSILARTCQK